MVGSELVDEYQTMSTDRADYVNQTVAILGNANSALETANWIFNVRYFQCAAPTKFEPGIAGDQASALDWTKATSVQLANTLCR